MDHPFYLESDAVTALKVTSTNDTLLLISWGPPVNPNGDILSYSVNIIDLGDGTTVRQGNTVSTSFTQMNLGISNNAKGIRCGWLIIICKRYSRVQNEL
jgi:hypothetical protein